MKLTDDTETFAIPMVSCIIERVKKGETEVLVQTRWKPQDDPKYSGLFELPGGKVRKFENIFKCLKREVYEETGLNVVKVTSEKTKKYSVKKDGAFAFKPFCCIQQVKAGRPWIGFVFVVEVSGRLKKNGDDTKDVHWIKKKDLKTIFDKTPKEIFTLHLGALDMYFKS
ncbi:MAG: NUDIX hydrolase [Nanoarchaeota archaeon]|nr:NUDIX hydrolase [Nanoarchaeota archaeon]